MSCAGGLHWSVKHNTCMDAQNAGCEDLGDIEECPESGIKHISHPSKCDHYILCVGGETINTFKCV
jgi:hypothetical protein